MERYGDSGSVKPQEYSDRLPVILPDGNCSGLSDLDQTDIGFKRAICDPQHRLMRPE